VAARQTRYLNRLLLEDHVKTSARTESSLICHSLQFFFEFPAVPTRD